MERREDENVNGTYDSTTTDLRPSAFDELREQNTTLATKNAEIRDQVRSLSSSNEALLGETQRLRQALADERLAAIRLREQETDRFLRRIQRLRRAVARERAHIAAEHASLAALLPRVEELAARNAALHAAVTKAAERLSEQSDRLLILTGERDEARRIADRVTERPEPIRLMPMPEVRSDG